jgi:dTMP kinase
MTETLNLYATDHLVPDITFIIDIPVELSKERLAGKKLDRLESEPVEFHQKVRDAFLDLSKKRGRYHLIDGRQHISEIFTQIKQIIHKQTKGV